MSSTPGCGWESTSASATPPRGTWGSGWPTGPLTTTSGPSTATASRPIPPRWVVLPSTLLVRVESHRSRRVDQVPVALARGRWSGVELGDQGGGVAGGEPSGGGQLSATWRRPIGAEFGVGALGLGPFVHPPSPCLLDFGAGGRLLGAGSSGGCRWVGAGVGAIQQAEHGE